MKRSYIIIAIVAAVAAYFFYNKKKATTVATPEETPAPQARVASRATPGKVPLPSVSRTFGNRQEAVNYYNSQRGACRFIELVGGGYEVQC